MKTSEAPVIVEHIFDAPIKKVWSAITDLKEMKFWYFENIDHFKAEIGSQSRFAVRSGERTFTHLWEVCALNPPHKIAYTWKYEEYSGDSIVSFELLEVPEGTKLLLIASVTEDFPDDIPEFKRESCLKGWEYFICYRLAEYLKK